MTLFDILGRYFWLIALVFGALSYLAAARSVESFDDGDPRATSEAKSLRLWFAMVSTTPWLVMGVGILFGGVPNVWSYFRPQDGNPYVLAWFVTIFLIALVHLYWVFFRGGAEKTVALQPFSMRSTLGDITLTPGRVKLFAAIGPFWVLLWVVMAVFMDAHIPK